MILMYRHDSFRCVKNRNVHTAGFPYQVVVPIRPPYREGREILIQSFSEDEIIDESFTCQKVKA
jgi:hypothetical protein